MSLTEKLGGCDAATVIAAIMANGDTVETFVTTGRPTDEHMRLIWNWTQGTEGGWYIVDPGEDMDEISVSRRPIPEGWEGWSPPAE